MFGLSLATIAGLASSAMGLVAKLWGGSSKTATAGDQKALDEGAAVKGAAIIIKGSAEASGDDVTKKAIDNGQF